MFHQKVKEGGPASCEVMVEVEDVVVVRDSGVQSALTDVLYIACHFILQ